MLDFILKMPPEGCNHARGHTMPFVANEIFACELQQITQHFFTPEVQEENLYEEEMMTPMSSIPDFEDSFPQDGKKAPKRDTSDVELCFDEELEMEELALTPKGGKQNQSQDPPRLKSESAKAEPNANFNINS